MSARALAILLTAWLLVAPFAMAQEGGTLPLAVSEAQTWNSNLGCAICNPQSSPSRGWVSGEYLLWWIKAGPSPPPLVTTGSPADLVPGAFGQPGTALILGGANLSYHNFSGGRIGAGWWLDPEQTWGLEASGFFLPSQTLQQTVRSTAAGSPLLFRPLNDVTAGENSFFLSAPGFVAGSLTMTSTSQLWGVEANVLMAPWRGDNWQAALFAGYRHLDLREGIDVNTFTNDFGNFFGAGFLANPSNPGTFEKIGSTLAVTDGFHTRNQFDGGQLGGKARFHLPRRFYVDVRAQVALGCTQQRIDIAGTTVQTQPGLPPASFAGGVLASGSNLGSFTHNSFSAVPSVGLRLGWQMTDGWSAFVGYDFLYWSNVVRPGDAMSRNVDFRGIPTSFTYAPGLQTSLPAAPTFHQTGFWAQGISFGLQYQY